MTLARDLVTTEIASLPTAVTERFSHELLLRWHDSPLLFARECAGFEPDLWQQDVLEAVPRHDRVAMKASKGPGKTFLLGILVCWWMLTRKNAKIACTSITGDNLKAGLWSEIRKVQERSPILMALFDHTGSGYVEKKHPDTWFCHPRTWQREASAEKQASTLAGLHADHIMLVVDEVGDIPDSVMAAGKAVLANRGQIGPDGEPTEAKIIMAGNPSSTSGPLWNACNKDSDKWFVYEISGDPDDPKRAPRVSLEYCREMLEEYGEDSDVYRVNVLGKFPKGQSNTLISRDVAEAAAKRVLPISAVQGAPRILGVDVARFGKNRTVLQARQGRIAFKPKVFRELSGTQVAGQIVKYIQNWKPHAVFIDSTGVGGPVFDLVSDLGYEHLVFPVDSGSAANDAKRFLNRRVEMWYAMRDWFNTGGSVPYDLELISEVSAPIYKFTPANKWKLEGKDDLEKRGVPSPDKADALALTFAMEVHPPDIIEQVRELDEVSFVPDLKGANYEDENPYR